MNKTQTTYNLGVGNSYPLGVTALPDGVNFSLFSRHADSIVLKIKLNEKSDSIEIPFDSKINRTGNIWHIFVHKLPIPFFYCYAIDGHRKNNPYFKPNNLLMDPYAKSLQTSNIWNDEKILEYRPWAEFKTNTFDWQGVESPNIPLKDLIIYEMHVRGFTQDATSKVQHKGKFLGLIEKIPYLKDLGINAVNLLPIFEFNEKEVNKIAPLTHQKLFNYWGYSTQNFFTPMNRYVEGNNGIEEFKTLVRELHRNGIEVILDVVFNHTGEGNNQGPILSFKGIDCPIYYMVDKHGQFLDFTGCGNTVNCNHPIVMEFIRDCLRYWVTEMHVDGFRFDLAAIFKRDSHGNVLANPPILDILSHDPVLAKIKLIAEPWDAVGLYELGNFYPKEKRWAEWNGKYRDSLRKFIKGDKGQKKDFAARICGSQDIFWSRSPEFSINFVTAHDGFTLADLVSYNQKHNEDNAEGNRDGFNSNDSWNCGSEGFTKNPEIQKLRKRQMRNFILGLMVSQGVPMLSMGDEYGHSCRGNNNPWCHDSKLNWFNWDHIDEEIDFFRFYRKMIQFRNSHSILKQDKFLNENDIKWHGIKPESPGWEDDIPILAFTLIDHDKGNDIYVAFNTGNTELEIEIPKSRENKSWHWVANTAQSDISEDKVPNKIKMIPYSSLLLESK